MSDLAPRRIGQMTGVILVATFIAGIVHGFVFPEHWRHPMIPPYIIMVCTLTLGVIGYLVFLWLWSTFRKKTPALAKTNYFSTIAGTCVFLLLLKIGLWHIAPAWLASAVSLPIQMLPIMGIAVSMAYRRHG